MNAQATETRENASKSLVAAEDLAGAETILLVEDEAFVREVTAVVLRSAGYEVLTARNAAEAVSVYVGHRDGVEFLLTDVVLPGENGRALARRLQRENQEIKVLLVTGYGEQMGLQGAQEQGAQEKEECLAKPFSAEVLLRRVRQVLDRTGVGSGPIAQAGSEGLFTPACGNA